MGKYLQVFYPDDIANVLNGIWRGVLAARATVETDEDRDRIRVVESILFAVAISFGVEWRGGE